MRSRRSRQKRRRGKRGECEKKRKRRKRKQEKKKKKRGKKRGRYMKIERTPGIAKVTQAEAAFMSQTIGQTTQGLL